MGHMVWKSLLPSDALGEMAEHCGGLGGAILAWELYSSARYELGPVTVEGVASKLRVAPEIVVRWAHSLVQHGHNIEISDSDDGKSLKIIGLNPNHLKYFEQYLNTLVLLSITSIVNTSSSTRTRARISKKQQPDWQQGFDEFWRIYDKKVGREKCMRLWQKLSQEERDEVIMAAPQYVAATPDKKYRKNPETYLRNKGWQDEIVTAGPQQDDRMVL
jgi:hypothetical protein